MSDEKLLINWQEMDADETKRLQAELLLVLVNYLPNQTPTVAALCASERMMEAINRKP
jgi:hypothetical protein